MKIQAFGCNLCGDLFTVQGYCLCKGIDSDYLVHSCTVSDVHICKNCHDVIGKHYENINRNCDSPQLSTCQL